MTIQDADPRVPPSVAEIVAAVQQIVVFFVWSMKPTCFCVLDILKWMVHLLFTLLSLPGI